MNKHSTTNTSIAETEPEGSKAEDADERWAEIDALTDEEIAKAVADDPDAPPILDETFWANAKLVMPVAKQAISIRLDEDVLTFFKALGPGYQSRINAVLRAYMDAKS